MIALKINQLQIFQLSSIYTKVLIYLQNLMLSLGYTSCFIIYQFIYFTVESGTFFCDVQSTVQWVSRKEIWVMKGIICYCTINAVGSFLCIQIF
jgi:hypothetical protein